MPEPDPSFWKNKIVLVTGSTGFAGGHLSQYLHQLGANVRCFARSDHNAPVKGPRSKVVIGDVQDYQSLLEALKEVDTAFHLAATTLIPETRAKIFGTFSTNSLGTLNFLMAARERKVKKLVYVSTCHVYGKQEKMPIAEDATPHPIDIYSASKLAGESLALSFAEMEGMDISISRAFNHYGPGQRPEFLIPSIILRLLKEQTLEMGNPAPTRDFTYVADTVEALLALGDVPLSTPLDVFNVGTGNTASVEELVTLLEQILGTSIQIEFDTERARLIERPHLQADISKIQRTTTWRPTHSLRDGLKQMCMAEGLLP